MCIQRQRTAFGDPGDVLIDNFGEHESLDACVLSVVLFVEVDQVEEVVPLVVLLADVRLEAFLLAPLGGGVVELALVVGKAGRERDEREESKVGGEQLNRSAGMRCDGSAILTLGFMQMKQ